MRLVSTLLFIVGLFVLNGCGTMPASGPYSKDIKKAEGFLKKDKKPKVEFKYNVELIDSSVISDLSKDQMKLLSNIEWPQNSGLPKMTVNVGDTIQVSVFESESGGLFIPADSSTRPGNFVNIPAQTIGANGTVKVPYAGEVPAAGRTTEEIAQEIERLLENQAIEPQVVVSFGNRTGAEMSVIGAVNNAQRISLGFNNYKILDTVAAAGGPSSPGYETWVQLQRSGKEYSIPFDQLVLNPNHNVYAEINDTVYLYRQPEIFNAYGAVLNPGAIPFGKRDLTLSEALGLSNGLNDVRADPAEIYIYRQPKTVSKKVELLATKREKSVLDSVRVLDSLYKVKAKSSPKKLEANTNYVETNEPATIYKLDLREASGVFMAQQFMMQDQDTIYVANSESVEFLKFLNIINNNSVTTDNTKRAY